MSSISSASRPEKPDHKRAPEKYKEIPKHDVGVLLQWASQALPDDRSKMKFVRAFSDGVMMAKLIHHYRPDIVEMNHFSPCSSQIKKRANWIHLNNRVFPKLGFRLTPDEIDDIASNTANSIETLLVRVKKIVDPKGTPMPVDGSNGSSLPSQARGDAGRSTLERPLAQTSDSIGKRSTTNEVSYQTMYNNIEMLNIKIKNLRTVVKSSYNSYLAKVNDAHEKLYGIPARFGTEQRGQGQAQIPAEQMEAFKQQLRQKK